MNKIKKLIFDLSCNSATGGFIASVFSNKIPDLRWRNYRFSINKEKVNKKIAASIFFGFYESSEIRFIHKYFKGNTDVLELGGSLGIVSSHIASLMKPGHKQVVVEPNPYLIPYTNLNIQRHATADFKIINAALSYGDGSKVQLAITSNSTASQLVESGRSGAEICEVEAVTVSSLIHDEDLDNYTLVCDIEGAEIGFLLNDREALSRCKEILIELHDTSANNVSYFVEDLVKLITDTGFQKIDNEGPVYFFRK